jgi:hypothetical protein
MSLEQLSRARQQAVRIDHLSRTVRSLMVAPPMAIGTWM